MTGKTNDNTNGQNYSNSIELFNSMESFDDSDLSYEFMNAGKK